MASTKVSYEDWLASGIYPEGSPGKDAGKKFDPADKNLKKYYDNYVVEWDKATEDHRKAINKQHGFTDSEGGVGGAVGGAVGGVAGAMGYKTPTVSPEVPGSETERVDVKQKFGTPFAESIRGSMIGEVKGLGKRSEDMGAIDRERDFNNAVLAQAQQFASSGMSFSTPMLHAEEDMVRDLARQRLVDADEAATLQKKLDMSRWEAAEPLQRLAAEAKLGDPATGLDFKPGAFGERLLDLDIASVPEGVVKGREESSGDGDKDDGKKGGTEHYTDGKGNTCYYEDRYQESEGGPWVCPVGKFVGGGAGPDGEQPGGDHFGAPGHPAF